ncbi:MAG TPA: Uma2 family endonuclease [Pyrinomonadaceae bacterium]|nr:Uma2 family endonuclease [Pyrinomonadaceae bacterium]
MSTQLTATRLTPEEYLAAERESEFKSEYVEGVVYAMTGASVSHIQVVLNISSELKGQLRGRSCLVLPSEMKVKLPDSRKFFYPDIVVICGQPAFHDERRDIIENPLLLIEVLSESTEKFDRGAKFQAYQTLESLREYVLVAQDRPIVEQYVRGDGGTWIYSATIGIESTLRLMSIECVLRLADVYENVELG